MKKITTQTAILMLALVMVFSSNARTAGAVGEQVAGLPGYVQNIGRENPASPALKITRISEAPDGSQANASSYGSSISADGRFVAFESTADNLGVEDNNGESDVYILDRETGSITLASVASNGTQGSGAAPSISNDGRFVAFESGSEELVTGDTNGFSDVFVYDRETGETCRISVASDGTQGDGRSSSAAISGDGRFVAFSSAAQNLVSGDTNQVWDVFVHDRETGETIRVSIATDNSQANAYSSISIPKISADGSVVAFASFADNLVSGDTNGMPDVFVHDLKTGETGRVSVASDGSQGNNFSVGSAISADGRYVAFDSQSDNLVNGDDNGAYDVFIHDRQTGQTSRISVGFTGITGTPSSHVRSISLDGRFVVFDATTLNPGAGDSTIITHVYLRDRQTGETRRISIAIDGIDGNGDSFDGVISADGRYITFSSAASNLVIGDTNQASDVFLYDSEGALLSFSISGRILDERVNPLAGAAVSVESGASTTTDSNGFYLLDGLPRGSYTVRPYKYQYYFSPPYRSIQIIETSISDQNFTAMPLPGFNFQPALHGYPFQNYLSTKPLQFQTNDLVDLFGGADVCISLTQECRLRKPAEIWKDNIQELLSGGLSDGAASTSLRFFLGLDTPSDFQVGAKAAHDLQFASVQRHLAKYFLKQSLEPIAAYKDQISRKTPAEILNQILAHVSNGGAAPAVLFIRMGAFDGQALVPYAVEERSDRQYWVQVYDSNYPDDANRFLVINTLDNTWSYDMGGAWGVWSGDAGTGTLGIVPLSKYVEQAICPWCGGSEGAKDVGSSSFGQVWLNGPGHLLMSDPQGRRIGYLEGAFINELPEAFFNIMNKGTGAETEPIYYIPLSVPNQILLTGRMLQQPADVQIAQYGPGYAVMVEVLSVTPETRDQITISPDGKQVTFLPGSDLLKRNVGEAETRTVSLTFAFDSPVDSFELQVRNIAVIEGSSLSVSVSDQKLIINNANGGKGSYDLLISRVNAFGEELFGYMGVPIDTGDTHIIDYRSFAESNFVTLQIDIKSLGVHYHYETLGNTAINHRLYFPYFSR